MAWGLNSSSTVLAVRQQGEEWAPGWLDCLRILFDLHHLKWVNKWVEGHSDSPRLNGLVFLVFLGFSGHLHFFVDLKWPGQVLYDGHTEVFETVHSLHLRLIDPEWTDVVQSTIRSFANVKQQIIFLASALQADDLCPVGFFVVMGD